MFELYCLWMYMVYTFLYLQKINVYLVLIPLHSTYYFFLGKTNLFMSLCYVESWKNHLTPLITHTFVP